MHAALIRKFRPRGTLIYGNISQLFYKQDPSFSHGETIVTATTDTFTDQDSIVRSALPAQVRMQGFRVVRNFAVNSENISAGGGWTLSNSTVTSGISAPDGTNTAFTLTATAAIGQVYRFHTAASTGLLNSFWVRRRTGAGLVQLVKADTGNEAIATNTTWQRFSGTITSAVGGTTGYIGVICTTNGDSVDIWHPQQEDVVGQVNQNPAEYVSNGVLPPPYQGLGVDGIKAFSTLNGNTVASNLVTEATGALISASIRQGLLAEPAATQLVTPLASVRDMTNAAWVLGATMTRARNQVGMDGVANTATLLTGGATLATNTILQTLTAAASPRTYSVGLKLVSGTIEITQDGTAWTNITSLLNTATFTVVPITASILNASFGIRASISGSAVADWNQFQAGATFTSRIPEALAAINADVVARTLGGEFNPNFGTLFVDFIQPVDDGTQKVALALDAGTANNNSINIYSANGTTRCIVWGGASPNLHYSIPSPAAGTRVRIAFAFAINDGAAFQNGVAMTLNNAGSTLPTVTTFNVGNNASVLQLSSTIAEATYFPSRLPNANVQALSV